MNIRMGMRMREKNANSDRGFTSDRRRMRQSLPRERRADNVVHRDDAF